MMSQPLSDDNSISHSDLPGADMLLSSFAGPMLLLDASLCITAWNEMYETLYGLPPCVKYGYSFFAAFPYAARYSRIVWAV